MEMWNLVAGGAAVGLIASCWGKIKEITWKICSLFIQQIEIPSEPAHNALVAYLIKTYRRSRLYERMYGAYYEHHRDGRYGLVPFEQYGNRGMILWNGWVPFLFSNAQEKKAKGGTNNNNQAHENPATKVFSTITYIRGTLDVEEILRRACHESNDLSWSVAEVDEKQKNRFVIHYFPKRSDNDDEHGYGRSGLAWYQLGQYRLLAHTPEQLGKAPLHSGKALDGLIFPQRVKGLIKEIELWRSNRTWHQEKGIPWKRGWLLYGPPGTGKTALARAFAEDLNMPIYVFNLAEMSNHELIKAWSDMQVNVPCIALIEDIDNVFHGRENVARKNGGMMSFLFPRKKDEDGEERKGSSLTPLTFDCLLNCLDGVERTDGIFAIISTNDISKVDPALGQPRKLPDGTTEFISTRPGRIDKAVELTYMEPADKKLMAKRILGEYPDEYLAMLEFIDRYTELQETPAQFQESCGQIALKCFWREQEEEKLALLGPPPSRETKRVPAVEPRWQRGREVKGVG